MLFSTLLVPIMLCVLLLVLLECPRTTRGQQQQQQQQQQYYPPPPTSHREDSDGLTLTPTDFDYVALTSTYLETMEEVSLQFDPCKCRDVLLVSDDNDPFTDTLARPLLRTVMTHSLRFKHFKVSNSNPGKDDDHDDHDDDDEEEEEDNNGNGINDIVFQGQDNKYTGLKCDVLHSFTPRLYVLMTRHAKYVMKTVENCTLGGIRNIWSNFPHNSRWQIVVTSEALRDDVVLQQRGSVLDNVAVTYFKFDMYDDRHSNTSTQYRQEHTSNATMMSALAPEVLTFVWRENRTKVPQQIDLLTSDVTPTGTTDTAGTTTGAGAAPSCVLFPNIYHGLNGRPFSVKIRPHDYSVYVANGTADGSLIYEGFVIEVIQELARTLNFTYVFTPAPHESYYVRLADVGMAVQDGHVDFDAGLWCYYWKEHYNLSFSYPVLFDRYSGIYRRSLFNKERSLLLVYPFGKLQCLIVAGTFLYCIVMCTLILVVFFPNATNENTAAHAAHHHHSCYNNNSNNNNNNNNTNNCHHLHRRCQPSHRTTRTRNSSLTSFLHNDRVDSVRRVGVRVCDTVSDLVFSFVGQPTFPRPTLMSARVALFLLSFSTVVYYAFYTGSLTATMIRAPTTTTFDHLEEMFDSGEYRCDALSHEDYPNRVDQITSGYFTRLQTRCKEIVPNNGTAVRDFLTNYITNMDTKTIFLFSKNIFRDTFNEIENYNEFYIVPEAILNGNRAFIFPQHSQISYLFDPHILILKETGLINKIYFNYILKRNRGKSAVITGSKKIDTTINIDDFRWLLVMTLGMTSVCFLVLVGEWAFAWMNCYRKPKIHTTKP